MPQGIYPCDLTDDEWEKIQLLLPQDKPVTKHHEVDWRGVAEYWDESSRNWNIPKFQVVQ